MFTCYNCFSVHFVAINANLVLTHTLKYGSIKKKVRYLFEKLRSFLYSVLGLVRLVSQINVTFFTFGFRQLATGLKAMWKQGVSTLLLNLNHLTCTWVNEANTLQLQLKRDASRESKQWLRSWKLFNHFVEKSLLINDMTILFVTLTVFIKFVPWLGDPSLFNKISVWQSVQESVPNILAYILSFCFFYISNLL